MARTGARRGRCRSRRRRAAPDEAAGEAERVEPGRVVLLHPRRQDLPFPGRGRGLEAFELLHQGVQALRPFGLVVGIDPLPGEEEAHEVGLGDRLDLAPQPVQGVAVDARQQPALAPLLLANPGREAAAEDEALAFERGQGRSRPRPAQRRSARRAPRPSSGPSPSSRPRTISTSAVFRRPLARRTRPGAAISGASRASGCSGPELRQPLRRDPEAQIVRPEDRRAAASAARASNSGSQPERLPSSAVTKPSVTARRAARPASRASGQASSRTRAMAVGVERSEVRGGLRIEPAAER